jgi:hypothetical protein
MTDDFEDHCWKDVITPDVLEVYSCYRRKVFVGPRPALLAVDLYDVVYRGGPRPPAELAKTHPNTCGEYAFAAIDPTKRLLLPRAAPACLFSIRPATCGRRAAGLVTATKRNRPAGRSRPTTPSGRSSSRSRKTSSSPSSARAYSSARRLVPISPSSGCRR